MGEGELQVGALSCSRRSVHVGGRFSRAAKTFLSTKVPAHNFCPAQHLQRPTYNTPQPSLYSSTMPKASKTPGVREGRHNPLTEEYVPSHPWKQKAAKTKRKRGAEEEDNFVDSKASRKILQIGRELAEEEENENQTQRPAPANPAFDFAARLAEEESDEEPRAQYDDEEAWGDEDEEIVEEEVGGTHAF